MSTFDDDFWDDSDSDDDYEFKKGQAKAPGFSGSHSASTLRLAAGKVKSVLSIASVIGAAKVQNPSLRGDDIFDDMSVQFVSLSDDYDEDDDVSSEEGDDFVGAPTELKSATTSNEPGGATHKSLLSTPSFVRSMNEV